MTTSSIMMYVVRRRHHRHHRHGDGHPPLQGVGWVEIKVTGSYDFLHIKVFVSGVL